MSRVPLVLLALAAVFMAPCRVEAQIYLWRDADGRMVLSDSPRADGGAVQKTFPVERARGGVRVTRPPDTRSARFDPLIDAHAEAHGVDADLVRAVIQVESAFNPLAVSNTGAMGLMQLMPDTAEWIAKQLGDTGYSIEALHEPDRNIRYGTWYLSSLEREFHGNDILALAAYNAGRGNVHDWMKENNWSDNFKDIDAIPYKETRDYVRQVIGDQKKYRELYP